MRDLLFPLIDYLSESKNLCIACFQERIFAISIFTCHVSSVIKIDRTLAAGDLNRAFSDARLDPPLWDSLLPLLTVT